MAMGVALVSAATPLVSATMRHKWFSFPGTLWLVLLPVASIAAGVWIWITTGRLMHGKPHREWMPFAGAIAIFVLAFAGLAYSLFPYIVMDKITIWDGAAHPSSLKFVLVGAVVVLPCIVAYTVYSYRVFRGKARAELYD